MCSFPALGFGEPTLMHNRDALDKVKRTAQLEGLSVSAWARIVLLKAARETLRDHGEE